MGGRKSQGVMGWYTIPKVLSILPQRWQSILLLETYFFTESLLKVIGNRATVHRLVLASRGKGLASYNRFKLLLKSAWAIAVGMKLASFFLWIDF